MAPPAIMAAAPIAVMAAPIKADTPMTLAITGSRPRRDDDREEIPERADPPKLDREFLSLLNIPPSTSTSRLM